MRKRTAVETIAGEVTVVDIVEPAGSIVGRIMREREPVNGASVFVRSVSDAEEREWLETGADGLFRIDGLAAGEYEVKAALEDNANMLPHAGVGGTVVVSGAETRYDISLDPIRRIRGEVVDRTGGLAVSGCRVSLYSYLSPSSGSGPFENFSNWKPEGGTMLEADESRFELEIMRPGSYLIAARGDKARGPWGWYGPFDVDGAGPPEFVTVPAGGAGRLELTVEVAGGGPLRGRVRVSLQPIGGQPVYISGEADASGHVVIENVPLGMYRLRVSGEAYHDVADSVKFSDAPLERTVRLEPASWVLLDIERPPGHLEHHAVVCRALSGDPGWRLRSRDDDLPAASLYFQGEPVRIKTRPGRYRIRFEIKETFTASPTISAHDVDVVVPAGSETAVTVPLRG